MILSFVFVLLKLQLLSVSVSASASASASSSPIAKPNCQDKCGNIRIPYPFGIASGCYHNASYEIICNSSFDPPKPFLARFHLEVMYISLDSNEQTLTVGNLFKNICTSDVRNTSVVSHIDLRGSPYSFSIRSNIFRVEGCGANVLLKNSSGDIVTGCSSICTSSKNITNTNTNCLGNSCCEAALSSADEMSFLNNGGLDFYEIVLQHDELSSSHTCNAAAGLLDNSIVTDEFSGSLSTLLDWRISYDKGSCSDGVDCYINRFNSEVRHCNEYNGYQGIPYLLNGCQLVDECEKCKHGCVYNGTIYVCKKHQLLNPASIIGFFTSIGSVILLLAGYGVYRLVKRIKEVMQKAEYFVRNGGLLLKQQISSRDGIVDKTIIFRLSELERATNNFSEDRILGQGGQGTVYKGMLMDGKIVAIKKSKKVDKGQLEQFINEMVILSLINHRSIVKLLGCCLETEIPLLVYEFIPNGTLHQHIHDPSEEFHITWRMRLQIASESASALAYLHSSSSSPIYHRDIKSSNILLDEKYRAKVSDFGTSRAITIDQTHVTTCVQGTYGYLDPEYFQSNQFTEKSDVYSFGVVLVELITGKKSILPNGSGGWISLASEFLLQMENSHPFEILDSRISKEANEEELMVVANLAKQCLNMMGKERPTMKEVSVLLHGIWSPHVSSKPKNTDCFVSSESVVMDYNTSFLDTSPSFEALLLMDQ